MDYRLLVEQPNHVESVTLLVRNDDYKSRRRFDDDRRSKHFLDDKPNRRYGK